MFIAAELNDSAFYTYVCISCRQSADGGTDDEQSN